MEQRLKCKMQNYETGCFNARSQLNQARVTEFESPEGLSKSSGSLSSCGSVNGGGQLEGVLSAKVTRLSACKARPPATSATEAKSWTTLVLEQSPPSRASRGVLVCALDTLLLWLRPIVRKLSGTLWGRMRVFRDRRPWGPTVSPSPANRSVRVGVTVATLHHDEKITEWVFLRSFQKIWIQGQSGASCDT